MMPLPEADRRDAVDWALPRSLLPGHTNTTEQNYDYGLGVEAGDGDARAQKIRTSMGTPFVWHCLCPPQKLQSL